MERERGAHPRCTVPNSRTPMYANIKNITSINAITCKYIVPISPQLLNLLLELLHRCTWTQRGNIPPRPQQLYLVVASMCTAFLGPELVL